MKRFTLLFAVFLFTFLAQSQTPFCGSDWLPADPSGQVLQEQLEQQAFDYFSAFPARSSPTPDASHSILTIPVVVHIIHDNGPENISDAQVQQAIAWLNAACANTGYFDQGSGANTGIQFCLAQRTPEGLATTGITRNQSALTNLTIESQDLALKNIHRWAPKQYLNIWLVRAMCSSSAGCTVGAYAYRPSYHGTPFDGLVIEAQYFGGTQSQMSLTAHEIGHYLGLYHTFEGGCSNNDCLLNGDRICDTPPDQSTAAVPCGQAVNTCSTDAQSGFSTDQPDLTTNYLDYGDINCFHDFTPGQAERMNFYLNGVRHSLLDSKGCLPPCPAPVVSAFTASATTITPGQAITFTNASQNAAAYQWSVHGTTFSTATHPSYTFVTPGTYTVTLLAQTTNTALCAATTSQVVIQVACAAAVVSAFTPSVTSIQPGQSVTFTNNSQNAGTYQWSVNGTPFSTATNPAYTFGMPGTYTVTLLAQNSAAFCNMDTSQLIIQVVCAVVADFTVSNLYPAENEPVTITNTSQNATIFSWTINGIAQADTLTTLTFTEAGLYTIQLTAGDGLCQSSAQQQVSVQDSCVEKTFQYALTGDNPLLYWQGFKIASLLDSSLLLVTQALQSSGMPSTVISKFTADGIQLWSKSVIDSLVSTSQSLGNSIALAATADGGFMLGVSDVNNISHIAKLSADGEVEWTRGMEGSQTRIYDIQVNADQEILVLAYIKFFNNVLFIKFGSSGQLLWAKPIQSFIFKDYLKIAPLPDGGLIGIGNPTENVGQVIRLDAQGNVVWRKQTWLASGSQLHNVVVQGEEIFLVGNGYHATIWLLKMNLAGQVLWSKSHFNPDLGIDIQQMIQANDGLILSGVVTQSGAPVRAFLARFDTLGVMQWNRSYLHGFGSVFHDMVVGPRGHYILGNILSDLDKSAAWLLKTDALGFAGGCLAGSVPLLTADVVAYQNNQAFPGPEAPAIINPSAFALTDFSMTTTLLCEKACFKFPEICANNLDDDGDGLFDCLDADCPCMENPCQSKRNDHWYFGTRAGLDFSTEPPTLRSDGQTASITATANISDKAGNLLFYTDGYRIFNRFHQVMPQGTNPMLLYQSRISCLIIPYPGNPALYYVFINDQLASFQYALVDMRLDNGKGDVVPTAHFNSLAPPFRVILGLAATRSCTFSGYWLAVHNYTSQEMLAYRIDESGLQLDPMLSPTGDVGGLATQQMKFSPSGRQLARTASGGLVVLYAFDANFPQSGGFTNPQRFQVVDSALQTRGVEYSPTGQYLYVSGYKTNASKSFVYQFDLEAGNLAAIAASRVEIATDLPIAVFAELQAAPNGKIYVANTSSSNLIDVIHRPDAPGIACQYQKSGIVLPGGSQYGFGFSNSIASDFHQPHIAFSPDAPDSICDVTNPTNYYIKNVHCAVDSIQWTLVGLSGTIVTNYQYASVTYSGPGQGQLIVTAFTACGPATDTLTVTVHAGFSKILDLGPDRTVCDNGVFIFHAGSGFPRYRWQDGSTDSVLTTLLPGKYWVDVYDRCDNRQTDTVIVRVAPVSVLSLGPDVRQCAGLPMTFQRPGFFAAWQWSPAALLSCDTCASVTADPITTISWIVTARTTDGCLSVDTLYWNIVDTLFVTRDTVVCAGQTIDLYGVPVPADTTVHFLRPSLGPGCDTLLTVQALGLETPAATILARICADQFFAFRGALLPPDTTAVFHLPGIGCDSVVTVVVASFPPLITSLPADTSLSIGASLLLPASASGQGPLSFEWQPSTGLTCTSCLQPVASPLDTITYTLLVTDGYGCSARETITLRVNPDCRIIIPNAFTPNGDDINDWFYPATLPCVRSIRLWRVLDRWGQLVFERRHFEPNQENLGWDGSIQGKAMPGDVLVWIAELEYFDGRIEQRQGEVTLLR